MKPVTLGLLFTTTEYENLVILAPLHILNFILQIFLVFYINEISNYFPKIGPYTLVPPAVSPGVTKHQTQTLLSC